MIRVIASWSSLLNSLLKKTHMPRCTRPISRQRTGRVRLRSSTFARLASEISLSSLQAKFSRNFYQEKP
jgi:hypothetical protein